MNCAGEVPVLPDGAQAVLWSARKTEGTHTQFEHPHASPTFASTQGTMISACNLSILPLK